MSTLGRTTWLAGVLGLAVMLSGCEKPLFPPTLPRSQYERYLILHGRYRQAKQENAFGGEEPALRERLKPLDQ